MSPTFQMRDELNLLQHFLGNPTKRILNMPRHVRAPVGVEDLFTYLTSHHE